MNTDSRPQHIDHIAGVLRDEFSSSVSTTTVHDEVERAYDELARTSKVEAFIPILALRRSRDRISLLAADSTAVAGFVQTGTEPTYQPGDVAHLVDGRFQVTRVERTPDAIRYLGRWLDPVDAHA